MIFDELAKSENWDSKVPAFRLFKIKAGKSCGMRRTHSTPQ
jgi:hypothetical protein